MQNSCVLSVLQVKAPQPVLEKQTVGLICETTCSLTEAFIWYKNGEALKIHSKTLQLQSERSDSGRYSCAVRGHEHLPSPAVSITVMYPPQNVSVSITGSGEIVEGDSVTLSCSSDANPPALNFRWFKENQSSAVGSGQSFSISSFNSSHSGRYYCEAKNQHGSQRSESVSVSVKDTSAGNAPESGDDDKILYASVQCRKKNKDTKKPEEDEIQYASITVRQPATEAK
ncbi:B-cell receptor CD22-like [Sinocyclocheilus grahami]|uniref:B-cell receptor CD22-like n=1 Tax=Sinocyclocheilus grahami TaxID=75366 RepID=UPI0007AC9E8B|nr:PREDICTED: B-cell receptor CD22-like [Sinocyclocheilus grahami]